MLFDFTQIRHGLRFESGFAACRIYSKSTVIRGIKVTADFGRLNFKLGIQNSCSKSKNFFFIIGITLSPVKSANSKMAPRIRNQMFEKLTRKKLFLYKQ